MESTHAAAAVAEALGLTDDERDQIGRLLGRDDVRLIQAVAGRPIAAGVFSRLVQLRQLQTAVEQMSRTAAKIEMAALREGLGGQLEAGQFRTAAEVTDLAKRHRPRLKVYRAPHRDAEPTPPVDQPADRPPDPEVRGPGPCDCYLL